MGTHYSPRTVTDGLVFAFDTGNNKSYKGVPTTNLAPYISTHGTSDFTLPSLPEGVTTVHSKGAIINGSTDWADIFQTSGYSIPAGERLVISAWVYIPADKVNNRFNINADINGNNTGLASWHDLAAGQWHKLTGSWLNNTGATANATYTRVEPWTPAEWTGGTNTAYGINFMVESGPFAADYKGSQALPANTTRSVTEGLLDLTKNSTINITDLDFNSNAEVDFDGTDGGLIGVPVNHSYLDSSAIEVIVNPNTLNPKDMIGGYRHNGGYSQPTIGSIYIDDNRFYASVITSAEVYRTITSSTITANQYYHVVFNKDTAAGIMEMYVNGVSQGTVTFDAATYGQWSSAGNYIGTNTLDIGRSTNTNAGQGWGTSTLDGQIPIFKVYSKTLSADEVQQNYNALKGRFGL